ncbi:MAG: prepilin-type N-terminal cleavage/methylation domain-containing protein [Planctomycetaceae bacterium]|jgi:prepilin-type N-terminal cleavage/methylation domain-containing protein|nr:prepilin-type N-terminal cleavage/methylation domain-containing protein [Planctomycetaceae bacterium]
MTRNVTLFKGFTLVELMVVVVIIGILAGLLTVAVNSARNMVNQSVAKVELNGIAMAIEAYKQKYGEYPPDFTDKDAIVRHVQKRWPRYTPVNTTGIDTYTKILADIKQGAGADGFKVMWDFTDSGKAKMSALAFWLGGFPATVGEPTTLAGFHADSNDPFFARTAAAKADPSDLPREAPLLEITESNFKHEKIDGTNNPTGMSFFVRGQPVAYFRGTSATTEKAKQLAYNIGSVTNTTKWSRIKFNGNDGETDYGYVFPYATSAKYATITPFGLDKITWANASSFQLIMPGKDGRYNGNDTGVDIDPPDKVIDTNHENAKIRALKVDGGDTASPPSDNITPLDLDNIVNFGDTANIEGQLP